ncbi:MAG: Smr/MutS family protein [Rhodoferax sp.]|jgi:DNA-nicking Smr family endonuclease|nr:Smr/MutS family protein [Rhodoferax sp.]
MKSDSPRLRSLTDLKQVKQAIDDQARVLALAEARRLEQHRRQASARELFLRAAGEVQALPDKRHAAPTTQPPEPIPRQRLRDHAAVLHESISDEFDVSTLLDVDDQLSFRRPGIGSDVTRKLRKGHWSIQRALDLHGLRTDDARAALTAFIRDACQQGIRCVRIVHGKGLGSPGKAPVLKHKVHGWLVQKSEILAFVQARPAEGGAGALVVLLQPTPAAR